jgi:hypothetical protein
MNPQWATFPKQVGDGPVQGNVLQNAQSFVY